MANVLGRANIDTMQGSTTFGKKETERTEDHILVGKVLCAKPKVDVSVSYSKL